MSDFRVEKLRVRATLVLANGPSVEGTFFLSPTSPHHGGPERVVDLLNESHSFFPFEVDTGHGHTRFTLINRTHVYYVRLAELEVDAAFEPAFAAAPVQTVEMTFPNEIVLRGDLHVELPAGHDRLSDYLSLGESFRYLDTIGAMYVVNFASVMFIVPADE